MKIVLKTLEWSNMFSYGPNNIIHLDKNPITQLTAINGSGKTSIALIIQELLYSKNIQGIKKGDILNRFIKDNYWNGKLTFYIEKDEYVVSVERRGANSKVILLKNSQDISEHKIPDTYKKIKNILNYEFEVFSQLTYQSSVDLLEFIKATDTNRKKFLINLFNLNKYPTIGEVIKVKLNNIEKQRISTKAKLSTIVDFLNNTIIQEKLIEKSSIEIPEELVIKRNNLENEIKSYQEVCSKIDNNNLLIQEKNSIKLNLTIEEPELVNNKVPQLRREVELLQQDINNLNKKISNLDTSDTCYACHQPIDNSRNIIMIGDIKEEIAKIKNNKDKLETEILEEDNKYNKYLNDLTKWQEAVKNKNRFEQLSQLIDNNIPIDYPDLSNIKQELEKVEKQLLNLKQTKKEVEEYNKKVITHNIKVDTLINQKREFLASKVFVEKELSALDSKVNNLTILRKAFSTTGLVAYKLENITKELEDTINEYLTELSDGQFKVVFRLTGEKLNIIVQDEGKEAPIETVSRGEFSRLQTAILLAVRSILSKIGGNSINLLFLDEISGVLDSDGKEKLIEVLREEDNLNLFLISHDFTHPLLDKVSIEKENKISKIV